MSQIAFVNGQFLPQSQSMISIEDRGLLFADSVYEVVYMMDGRFVDMTGHLDRLERSLNELEIQLPMSLDVLSFKILQLAQKNRLETGMVYIQITRGSAPRDFKFPQNVAPNILMMVKRMPKGREANLRKGIKVVTVPDIRWKRRDIKTTCLLAQVLAKQRAHEGGAGEAWLMDDEGYVTEGGASNAWIVKADGTFVTRQTDHLILSGVTRSSLLHLIKKLKFKIEIRPFLLSEAYEAKEAFISGAAALLTPVVQINSHVLGDGKIGPYCSKLLDAYLNYGKNADESYRWEYPSLS